AQAAADVHVAQAGARLDELDVDPRRFIQGAFDHADVGDLAAEMKVEQLEAVGHAQRLQLLEAAKHFSDGETEFGPEAAGRLPAPAAARRELDPHPDLGP